MSFAPLHSPVMRDVEVAGDPVTVGLPYESKPFPTPSDAAPDAKSHPVSAVDTPTEPIRPSADEHEELLRRGLQEGYDAGVREGRDRGEREGREAGHAAGLEAGRREAILRAERAAAEAVQQVRTQWVPKLDRMLDSLRRELGARLAEHEDALIALAYEALGALVIESVSSPDAVRSRVRALIERATQAPVRILLSPRDLAWLQDAPDWGSLRARFPSTTWEADDALGQGDCVIETRSETLEARLEAQLRTLRDAWVRAAQPTAADARPDTRGARQ
jgi:flagellar assembly protein FliH